MITNITLKNFKCFRQLDINPKLLTVLIGANGTGKSSVLQALLLLKQSVGGNNIKYQGEYVNLNKPEETSPNFLSESPKIEFRLQGKAPTGSGIQLPRLQYAGVFGPDLQYFSSPDDSRGLESVNSPHGYVLKHLRFVPATRGFVRPKYALGVAHTEEMSVHQGLDKQEAQLATNLSYGRAYEEKLSTLMKRVTGTGLRAETVPPQSVEVKSLAPSGAVNIVSEGFGANALILLLHQLITAEKGSTILIEEPEIHLHPKAQAELAEALADTAKDEDKQIIMTTHSEYVAGRLLTLVAEGKLTTDELAIYSFDKDNETGECTASEIEVTERGQTKGGLRSFFQADMGEMRRYVEALRARAKA